MRESGSAPPPFRGDSPTSELRWRAEALEHACMAFDTTGSTSVARAASSQERHIMAEVSMAERVSALHRPVMAEECLELLAPAVSSPNAVLIDCTLGMGGHTEAALQRFPHLHVIGIDRDAQAIELASQRLARFERRFTAVHTTYDRVSDVAAEYGREGKADGVLMDLGVSSYQLDMRERGFSYAYKAPLDMRMDSSGAVTAADIVNSYEERDIARILRVYGEEKFASRIARFIVQYRRNEPLADTEQLADIVKEAIPAPARRAGGNPAKRTFQALRIAVNKELPILEEALPNALNTLRIGGRIVVESYHSLEDRLVKEKLAEGSRSTSPAGLPVELEGHEPYLRLLTKGALKAPDDEVQVNSRAQSVRVRAAEKLRDVPVRHHAHSSVNPLDKRSKNQTSRGISAISCAGRSGKGEKK